MKIFFFFGTVSFALLLFMLSTSFMIGSTARWGSQVGVFLTSSLSSSMYKSWDSRPRTWIHKTHITVTKDIYHHCTSRIALTFDDGPSEYTEEVLDILQSHKVLATFFVTGSHTQQLPHIVTETQIRGHQIGNHTWDHPHLTTLKKEQITHQIQTTSSLLEEVLGSSTAIMRPPYGDISPYVRGILEQDLGQEVILWTHDSTDWRNIPPDLLVHRATSGLQDGSVILMHDTARNIVDGLPELIQTAKDQGYCMVRIQDL